MNEIEKINKTGTAKIAIELQGGNNFATIYFMAFDTQGERIDLEFENALIISDIDFQVNIIKECLDYVKDVVEFEEFKFNIKNGVSKMKCYEINESNYSVDVKYKFKTNECREDLIKLLNFNTLRNNRGKVQTSVEAFKENATLIIENIKRKERETYLNNNLEENKTTRQKLKI